MIGTGTNCAASPQADVVAMLPGGRGITLRRIGPEDRAGLATLFARLTPESRLQRFLSPKRELTPRELTLFTNIDHFNHEAIAAIDPHDNSIVGAARYIRYGDRPGIAEVAIEVADAFHRLGIGTALASHTIHLARANGVGLLTATTLWDNRAARRLLARHGFRARASSRGEIKYELELTLAPTTANAARRRPHPQPRPLDRALGSRRQQ